LNIKYEPTIKALISGELKAAYMAGFNPVRADPKLRASLSQLDFLVVQDLFLTETAELADVVLPAASFAEIDGTFLGPAGETLLLRRAIPPTGRPDWQILAELGRKMGEKGFEFLDSRAVTHEMLASVVVDQNMLLPGSVGLTDYSPPGPARLFQFGSGTRTSKVSDLEYLTRKQVK
jgi:predicted molibdopterin-dependent oxidoreductase YjgC